MTGSVAICSSWNGDGYERYGRRFVSDFDTKWEDTVPLYVTAEDHHLDDPSLRIVQLLQSRRATEFKERYGDVPSANGIMGNGTYNFKLDAIRFCNKVYAIRATFDRTWAYYDYLVWLDGDVITHEDVTEDWLLSFAPRENELLTYLGRSTWPENGFIMFNLHHPMIGEFLSDWVALYDNGSVFGFLEWHDCYTMNELIKKYRSDDGVEFRNLGSDDLPDGYHIFVNSRLGERLDHLKGPRKDVGSSLGKDITDPELKMMDYWMNVPSTYPKGIK